MFARNTVRMASRQAFRPAVSTKQASRAFTQTPKINDPENISEDQINVVRYHQGQRTEQDLKVEHNTGPVAPAGADVEVKATPLSQSVYAQLTPTLRRFTCPGKVAIVTG